jgi:hypothetical protein
LIENLLSYLLTNYQGQMGIYQEKTASKNENGFENEKFAIFHCFLDNFGKNFRGSSLISDKIYN